MPKKLTKEEFMERCMKIHHNRNYDYSKVEYKNTTTKVIIICPIHNEFQITPHQLLKGSGCQKCGGISCGDKLRKTTDQFINCFFSLLHNEIYS